MSSEDSFINEVSEEVRKDRLYALYRRYGWIAVALIVIVVGGAAFNEWRKSEARAEAEARGDAILSAIEIDNPDARAAAIAQLGGEGETRALMAMVAASEPEPDAEALAALESVSVDPTLDQIYRDLATLKLVLLEDEALSPDEKLSRLNGLAVPGAPFRLLALEQIALAQIDRGDTDAALAALGEIAVDGLATEGLRRRAQQLIVALGGTLDAL